MIHKFAVKDNGGVKVGLRDRGTTINLTGSVTLTKDWNLATYGITPYDTFCTIYCYATFNLDGNKLKYFGIEVDSKYATKPHKVIAVNIRDKWSIEINLISLVGGPGSPIPPDPLADVKVKIGAGDPTTGYLGDKLSSGPEISLAADLFDPDNWKIKILNAGPFTRYNSTGDALTGFIKPSFGGDDLHLDMNLRVDGFYYDSLASHGTVGQLLSATATGTEWVDHAAADTTYTISAITDVNGALLRLTGSDATTDDVLFKAGTGTTIGIVDDSTIEIGLSGGGGFNYIDFAPDTGTETVQAVDSSTVNILGGNVITTTGVTSTNTLTIDHDAYTAISINTSYTDGVVLQNVAATVDAYGHTDALSFDSIDLDLRYTLLSVFNAHVGDTTIHFTKGSISHTEIQDIGTHTHTSIDSHINDSTIHFLMSAIDHTLISNIGIHSHAQIDTHIGSTSNPHVVTLDQLLTDGSAGEYLTYDKTWKQVAYSELSGTPTIPSVYWTRGTGVLYPTTLTDKVGIGINTPLDTLHVYSTLATVATIDYGSSRGTVKFAQSSSSGYPFIHINNTTSGASLGAGIRYLKNSVKQFGFGVDYSASGTRDWWIYDYVIGAVRLLINPIGNVGLGTPSPTERLHVVGSIRVEDAYYDSNNETGTAGQILSSTAVGTDWIDTVVIPASQTLTWVAATKLLTISDGNSVTLTHTHSNDEVGITPAALTKANDTNVTLTLGGTPATSLLEAVSLTLGWTGTLADDRIASAVNWNTAYGWGDHAGLYDLSGTAAALMSTHETTYNHGNYDTAYTHSQITSGNPHNVLYSELSDPPSLDFDKYVSWSLGVDSHVLVPIVKDFKVKFHSGSNVTLTQWFPPTANGNTEVNIVINSTQSGDTECVVINNNVNNNVLTASGSPCEINGENNFRYLDLDYQGLYLAQSDPGTPLVGATVADITNPTWDLIDAAWIVVKPYTGGSGVDINQTTGIYTVPETGQYTFIFTFQIAVADRPNISTVSTKIVAFSNGADIILGGTEIELTNFDTEFSYTRVTDLNQGDTVWVEQRGGTHAHESFESSVRFQQTENWTYGAVPVYKEPTLYMVANMNPAVHATSGMSLGKIGFQGKYQGRIKHTRPSAYITSAALEDFGINYGATLEFWTVSTGTSVAQQVMIIKDNKVGIGIYPPIYKLDVSGDVRISSMPTGADGDLVVTSLSGALRTRTAEDILLDGGGLPITPAALTKIDDTNVTLSLAGDPSTALLQAVQLTLGWTGTLADSRITHSANWNTAYGWGDHADAGYLTSFTESDPIFTGHVAYGITAQNITDWGIAYTHSLVTTGNPHQVLYSDLTDSPDLSELHSHSNKTVLDGITSALVTNWNAAYGWGDHSLEGYLKTFTETDPVFTAHVASGITAQNITNWNTAFGWGDHSLASYLLHSDANQSVTAGNKLATMSDLETMGGEYFVSTIDPTGNNYPDTTGETNGAYWIIEGLGTGNDYTFTSGALSGETVADGYKLLSDGTDSTDGTGLTIIIPPAVAWGSIGGTLANQADLQGELDLKAPLVHTHIWAQVTSRPTLTYALTGDVTGTIDVVLGNNVSITTTVADNSHTHNNYMLRSSTGKNDPNLIKTQSGYRFEPHANNPTNTYYSIVTFGNGGNVTGQHAIHFTSGVSYTRAFNTSWSAWLRNWTDNDFSSTDIANWNTAFGWGDHSLAGYLTSYTDTNYYLTGVSGSGNGTVTFTVTGASNPTWNAAHTHTNDHAQSHTLTGSDHTVSGLTSGYVLTALTADTFGFAELPAYPDGSKWSRNDTDGYIYPKTLEDKVGIGTVAPTEKLDVHGNLKVGDAVAIDSYLKVNSKVSGGATTLKIQPATGNNTPVLYLVPSGTSTKYPAIFLGAVSGTPSGHPLFTIGTGNANLPADRWVIGSIVSGSVNTPSQPIDFYMSNADNDRHAVMTILNTDKVGIMTTTPAYNLDVTGTGRFTDNLKVDANILATDGYVSSTHGTYNTSYGPIAHPSVIIPAPQKHTFYGSSGIFTGAWKITLPHLPSGSHKERITFKVTIKTLRANELLEVTFGDYFWSTGDWHGSGSATCITKSATGNSFNANVTVRSGNNGTKAIVYIGELTDTWYYPVVHISDIKCTFTGATLANWYKNWEIDIENTAFENVKQTITNTLPASDYDKLINTPGTFPPSAHTHTHASITGQAEDDHHAKIHDHSTHTNIGANDHHNQAHVLDGSDHTVSGLTSGHVLTALSATTFGFNALPAYPDGSKWTEGTGVIYPKTLTNKVGIGLNNPAYLLDVSGTGYFQDDLYVNGYAGIGTTSPLAPLQVENASENIYSPSDYLISTGIGVQILNNSSNTAGTFTALELRAGASYSAVSRITTINVNGNSNTETALTFTLRNTVSPYYMTERMRIDTTGVGIGTTSPSVEFEVVGEGKFSSYVTGLAAVNGDHFVTLDQLDDNTYWTEGTGVLYPKDLANKVGIGTDNPVYLLDVSGTFRATGNSIFNGTATIDGTTTIGDKLTAQADVDITGVTTMRSPLVNLRTGNTMRKMDNIASEAFGGSIPVGTMAIYCSLGSTAAMLKFRISGLSYTNSWDVEFFAYLHATSGWVNQSPVIIRGKAPFTVDEVRVIFDSGTGNHYILLGNIATSWGYYMTVWVDTEETYSTTRTSLTGWTIAVSPTEPTSTFTRTLEASKYANTLSVYGSGEFGGKVKGIAAVNEDEFVIKSQLDGSPQGTVTSISAGNGMNFTTITSTGAVALGTPGSITQTSTNAVTATSHTHSITNDYVDLSTVQTIAGVKTWSSVANFTANTGGGGSTYAIEATGSINLVSGENYYIDDIPISVFIDAPHDGDLYARKDSAWASLGSGAGTVTDLSLGADHAVTVTIINSGGDNVTLPAATTTVAGVMTAADKTKLNALSTTVLWKRTDTLLETNTAGDSVKIGQITIDNIGLSNGNAYVFLESDSPSTDHNKVSLYSDTFISDIFSSISVGRTDTEASILLHASIATGALSLTLKATELTFGGYTTALIDAAPDNSAVTKEWVVGKLGTVDTNYYLTGVSGSGNGTVTFTVSGATNPTWSAAHTHTNDHNQSHVLTGGDHTASGLTAGHVLMATGATTFGFAALPAYPTTPSLQAVTDIENVTTNSVAIGSATAPSYTLDVTGTFRTVGDSIFNSTLTVDGGLVTQWTNIMESHYTRATVGMAGRAGAGTSIQFPKGAFFESSGNPITGYLKISWPFEYATMYMIHLDVLNYSGVGESATTYFIGGYNNTSTGNVPKNSVITTSNPIANLPIRWGYDVAGTMCIWIGQANTDWRYPKAVIRNVTVGYSGGTLVRWWDKFALTVTTTLGTVTGTKTNQLPLANYDALINKPTLLPMVYPAVGIALSTGSAWGTSITNNSTNWDTAYGWGDHSLAGYLTSYTDTNYYLTGVSGSGNGTVTFTVNGATNPTWSSVHTHSYDNYGSWPLYAAGSSLASVANNTPVDFVGGTLIDLTADSTAGHNTLTFSHEAITVSGSTDANAGVVITDLTFSGGHVTAYTNYDMDSRYPLLTTLNNYVLKAGDTMTGPLNMEMYSTLNNNYIHLFRSRGTKTVPVNLVSNDIVGDIKFSGFSSSAEKQFGYLRVRYFENLVGARKGSTITLTTQDRDNQSVTGLYHIITGFEDGSLLLGESPESNFRPMNGFSGTNNSTPNWIQGDTQVYGKLYASSGIHTINNYILTMNGVSNTGFYYSAGILDIASAGSKKFRFTLNTGEFEADGDVIAFSSSISDRRLKTNIHSLSYSLEEIIKLEPISFIRKNKDDKRTHLGLIAQDVKEILPEIVGEYQDHLTLNYTEIIPVLINAIKELNSRIKELEK